MTPFQEYAHGRWVADFPQWAHLREDLDSAAEPFDESKPIPRHVRYQISSPANPNNILWVVFTPDDIVVKFAVPGSHEHYDPCHYGGPDFNGERSECWSEAYEDAIHDYVLPVIEDRMFALHYGEKSILVPSVEEFLRLNQIERCQYESWSSPIREFHGARFG